MKESRKSETKLYWRPQQRREGTYLNGFQPRTLEKAVLEAIRFANRTRFTAYDVVEDINHLYPSCQPIQKGLVNPLSVAMILERRESFICIEDNKDKRLSVFIDNFTLEKYRRLKYGFLP